MVKQSVTTKGITSVHPFIDAHLRHKDVPLIFDDCKSLKMVQKKNHTFSFAFRKLPGRQFPDGH